MFIHHYCHRHPSLVQCYRYCLSWGLGQGSVTPCSCATGSTSDSWSTSSTSSVSLVFFFQQECIVFFKTGTSKSHIVSLCCIHSCSSTSCYQVSGSSDLLCSSHELFSLTTSWHLFISFTFFKSICNDVWHSDNKHSLCNSTLFNFKDINPAWFGVCGKLLSPWQCYYFLKGLSLSKKSSFKCCMAIHFFWHSNYI